MDVPYVLLKTGSGDVQPSLFCEKSPSTREGTGQRVRIKSAPRMAMIRVRLVRRMIFCWPSPRDSFLISLLYRTFRSCISCALPVKLSKPSCVASASKRRSLKLNLMHGRNYDSSITLFILQSSGNCLNRKKKQT